MKLLSAVKLFALVLAIASAFCSITLGYGAYQNIKSDMDASNKCVAKHIGLGVERRDIIKHGNTCTVTV
jgi:hypothetical protein